MGDDLETLVRLSAVCLEDGSGQQRGSGFFVAPGRVLTSASVLHRFGNAEVFVRREGRPPYPAGVLWSRPAAPVLGLDAMPLPDLAVLMVPGAASERHPCVWLGDAPGEGAVLADGYVSGRPAAPRLRGDISGVRTEPDGRLVECRAPAPPAELAGGPLLSSDTGRVVGVVKTDRAGQGDGVLLASAVSMLRDGLPDIWAMNQSFQRTDRRWQQAMHPESSVRDPLAAARQVLQDTLRTVEARTWSLPPLQSRADLHQNVWVRRVPQSSTHRVTRGPSQSAAPERFHWDPTRATARVTVVRGLPGYGKSWLLAYHAETLAREALDSLDEGTDPDRLRVPLLADCAALGYHLAREPSADAVITALIRAARGTGAGPAAGDRDLFVREVLEQGRAVICLDAVDEVPKAFRPRVQKALRLLAAGTNLAAGNNNLVISTRHSSLALLEEVSPSERVDVETLGFTSREASRFIGVWLAHDPSRRVPLDRALSSSDSLSAVASVPLLLSFLCRLADEPERKSSFPASRAQVCEEVVKSLLSGRWRSFRRNARDPEAPPDPVRRLRALSHAFGTMLDGWRSTMESVSRARLGELLAAHPDAAQLRAAAVARWEAWQRAGEAEPAPPPPDPVIWEFTFDGLLVDDEAEGGEPAVKALHSALRDFLLATYVAGLDESARREALERHRYFDADWQEIFVLAASLMDESDTLVTDILDPPKDPWFTQASFAARCVAECGHRVSTDTANRLLGVLMDDTASPRLSDTRRRVAAFGQLVRADVAPAVERAVAASEASEEEDAPATGPENMTAAGQASPQDARREVRLEAIVALAELGHPVGVERARHLLSPSVPQQARQRLITALAATGSPDAVERVLGHLLEAGSNTDLEGFIAALKPSSRPLLDAAHRLLLWRGLKEGAGQALGAALMECGEDGTGIVRTVAGKVTTGWPLRSRLYALLINAGTEGAAEEAVEHLSHPTLRAVDKSYVVEALIGQGMNDALTSAASLMVDGTVPWRRRQELARAVCASGPAGLGLVRRQCEHSQQPDVVMPHLLTLAAVRDPEGSVLARNYCDNEGVAAEWRGALCQALLDAQPSDVETDVAVRLIAGGGLTSAEQRLGLVTALARAGSERTAEALDAVLDQDMELDDANWPQAARLLAAASEPGRKALMSVVTGDRRPWRLRVESVLALAATSEEAGRVAVEKLGVQGVPPLWRGRLVFGLCSAGSAAYVGELADSLGDKLGAYEVFHRFMQGPNASLEKHFLRHYDALCAAMEQLPRRGARIRWNDEMLTSLGLTWETDEERRSLLTWSYGQVEYRVGKALHRLMLPDQSNAFSAAIDDSDENGAYYWLASNFPEYQEFVLDELNNLKDDLRSGRLTPPASSRDGGAATPTMRFLQYVTRALAELPVVEPGAPREPYFRHLRAHEKLLLREEATRLLDLACALGPRWPLYPGQLFTVLHSRSEGIDATERLSGDRRLHLDLLNALYGRGDFKALYLCASFGVQCFGAAAPAHFYAALGAEGIGQHDHAVRLMGLSGTYAQGGQVDEGLRTIGECGERHRWEPGAVQDLMDALKEGGREEGRDGGG
ncbi:DUF5663 domain-containing protein [Streptomyces naganishii]|uniref:NACHT domain-containing protein n=1 Tax=Streptomyces naganishii JCM 4654 TaxID=1306179 RepID=A0A918Y3B6_9ACTN|nr:DUF5663 domain-containing protein [Streptomyces naganishii]GHD88674.1 hypothetical protein GCM10010508_25610 [Streptomyces naganishii JCM 4654]